MNTTTSFDFRWANEEDEPEIRALVGSVAMPGTVSIRFAREPDYFLGTTIMGDTCDVLVVRDRPNGRLAGIACRVERSAYINGAQARLGYFGQIRIAPEFQGRWLIQRGANYIREASPPELLYMGVIASDNPVALKVLTGPRQPGGLFVRHLCSLITCAILLRPRRMRRSKGIEVRAGSPEELDEIVYFLNREGSKRQFFPAYTIQDFSSGVRMRGLDPVDILVARQNGEIVGTMAQWDQSSYKQEIIDSYSAGLRRLIPFYNLGARVLRARSLTPPGEEIPMTIAACVCVAGDDLNVMACLLSAAAVNAYERGISFLMIGLADRDPLLAVAQRYLHIPYHSELFAASWSQAQVDRLDARLPYIEIATL